MPGWILVWIGLEAVQHQYVLMPFKLVGREAHRRAAHPFGRRSGRHRQDDVERLRSFRRLGDEESPHLQFLPQFGQIVPPLEAVVVLVERRQFPVARDVGEMGADMAHATPAA